ncbi:ribonuclease Z, mitochondrial-like [Oppia nitens]|uniref:ribonuclease Z, mitochondrial-like n=1 Tax=Oppia nitens TaxID=1686743 RepID=UPI0023DB78BF|nr:ribonuclease Z, mitochondrial-like [Oppia nitens]
MASNVFHCNTCLKRLTNGLIDLTVKQSLRRLSYSSVNTSLDIKNMPKDKSQLLQKLRDHRTGKAKRVSNNGLPSGIFQLSVLGNGSKGNPRALYVSTDRNSYLFNCGEGTQRLANEHKLKLSKLENIFITKRCVENMNGIIGLALTLQDIGLPVITLHGPQNVDQMMSFYNHFLKFSGMKLETKSYENYNFEDTDLIVKCSAIHKSMSNEMNDDMKDEKDLNETTFLYLCKLKDRPGELLIKKCIELKIPPGPLLGRLKAGEDIVLPDNRVICSQDVMGPVDNGPIFVVIECPTKAYIDSIVTNELLQSLSNEELQLMSLIVHFTPNDVINDNNYQQWMRNFGDSVNHLFINEDNPIQSYIGANRLQIKLNLIDSFIFPLLHCIDNNEIHRNSQLNSFKSTKTLLKYHLRPANDKGFDDKTVVNIDVNGIREEALANTSFMESKSLYQIQQQNSSQIKEYPEIIFLGTGSAVPSKVRNTSAIWVNIDSETSWLLDCGEGTYGQLFRFYGKECESKLKQLKAIYVSHLHADHHLGILYLMKERSYLTNKRLLLLIPPAVSNWFQNYNDNVEKISHLYEIVLCKTFMTEINKKVLNVLKLNELKTALVPHCSHSYGLSFTTRSEPNYKIVYSGDTQPTVNLTKIGKNCDLLIHEASMEDQLVDEARLKFHSTTSEAIEMGNNMNAKFTILTHFSQRYAKIPVFSEKFNDKVGIAFDNMRIRMSDINKLPQIIPTIKCLFEDEIEELKNKSAQNLKRKEFLAQFRESMI